MLYSAADWVYKNPAPGLPKGTAATLIKLPEIFNVASVMIDRHVVEGRGAQVAIECGDQRVSYRDLLERTNRVGNVLRQLGVDPFGGLGWEAFDEGTKTPPPPTAAVAKK